MLTTSKPTLTTPAPTFRQALLFWLKLGLISFGGPAGQVAIMHEFLVTKNRWLSEERFLHALNYCMVLPGPEAQQLATYTGWLLHGTRGGLAAGILFVLPSVFILLAMSIVYVVFGQAPWIYALFNGLKPAVIAIVIQALIKIGKKSLLTPFHYVVALAAFTGLFFFNLPFPLIILAALITAVLLRKFAPGFYGTTSQKTSPPEAEPELRSVAGVSLRWLFGQLAIFALLWLLPFILLALFAPGFAFWKTLSLFFTQAAFITFGGAYAVLPYVAQFTVEELHWLTQAQVMDGLAMGETTPGPLIMVLAFVGFMGGYNHFGQNLWLGSLALLLTVFYTFLPCFLFIFVGAPFIERTRQDERIRSLLAVVTAAVVGVILNLAIYLGKGIVFVGEVSAGHIEWLNVAWIVVSLVALQRFKVNMILWIGVSAAVGLLKLGIRN